MADSPPSESNRNSDSNLTDRVKDHPYLAIVIALITGLLGGGGVGATWIQSHNEGQIARIQAENDQRLQAQKDEATRQINLLKESIDKDRRRTAACANVGAAAGDLVSSISLVQGAMDVEGEGEDEKPMHVHERAWNDKLVTFESKRSAFTKSLSEFYARGLKPPRDNDPAVVLSTVDDLLHSLPHSLSPVEWGDLKNRKQVISDWSAQLPGQCAQD